VRSAPLSEGPATAVPEAAEVLLAAVAVLEAGGAVGEAETEVEAEAAVVVDVGEAEEAEEAEAEAEVEVEADAEEAGGVREEGAGGTAGREERSSERRMILTGR
jgi:hypothetical protein